MKKTEKLEQLNAQELRDRVDELLRMVENGKSFEIINHGRIVAEINPPRKQSAQIEEAEQHRIQEIKRWLASMDQLAHELAPLWPKDMDAVDIVRDVRRDF